MYMMAGSKSYEATVGEHNSLKNIKVRKIILAFAFIHANYCT